MSPSLAGRARLVAARRALAATLAVAAIAGTVAACGALTLTPEPATPTDFPGLTGRFNAAGVQVRDWVSGDAGCDNPDLIPASISFMASGLDQATPVKVYLYIFRDRAAFDRHRDQIGPCAESFVTDPQTYEEVEQSPYVVSGQGPWTPGFEAAVRSVLATGGGNRRLIVGRRPLGPHGRPGPERVLAVSAPDRTGVDQYREDRPGLPGTTEPSRAPYARRCSGTWSSRGAADAPSRRSWPSSSRSNRCPPSRPPPRWARDERARSPSTRRPSPPRQPPPASRSPSTRPVPASRTAP